YCYHLVLHSFPTRRSSDLECPRARHSDHAASLRRLVIAAWGIFPRRHSSSLRKCHDAYRDAASWFGCQYRVRERNSRTATGVVRSEEHTSELQSLAYLVCR